MKNYILQEKTEQGVLGFYRKPYNENLSFEMIGDEKLTQKLLNDCTHKTVKLKNISYAIKGIKEKLNRLQKKEVMVTIPLRVLNDLIHE